MARRRNAALVGLGAGLTNVGDLLLRSYLQDRSQDRYDKRQRETQMAVAGRQEDAAMRAFKLQIAQAVSKGELDPMQASALLGEDAETFEPIRPSPRRRMEKSVGARIDAATSPEMVPDEGSVLGAARTESLENRGLFNLPAENDPTLGDPFANMQPVAREFAERASARRRTLQAKPTERVTITGPEGEVREQFVSPYDGPVQTKPTAAQQGALKGEEKIAEESAVLGNDALTALRGKAEGRIKAMVEALTRQAKVDTAAAEAGARKRAELAPDIVEAEVARGRQIADSTKPPTESERRAATNWAPLVKAHGAATELESKGAALSLGDITRSDYPSSGLSEPARQYAQAAKDFISTLGLIRSGVTVRPDERDTLLSTMFAYAGDDEATKRAKLQSREVYLAAMQAMVGRSAEEAGSILAEAINRGQIPQTVLTSVKLEPDIERAVLSRLKIPRFGSDGRPQ